MDPSISEAMETGPTARSLELPSTAYTRGGTKLESRPTRNKQALPNENSNQTVILESQKGFH